MLLGQNILWKIILIGKPLQKASTVSIKELPGGYGYKV